MTLRYVRAEPRVGSKLYRSSLPDYSFVGKSLRENPVTGFWLGSRFLVVCVEIRFQQQRQAQCKNWGFKCKCRRCILEHSFKKSLNPIVIVRFEQWNEKAKELIAERSQQQQLDMNLWEHAEFTMLFQEAEEIIRSSHLLKTEEEKLWIHASFSSVYLLSTMLNGFFPSGEKLMEAIRSTVPGDLRNLSMAAGQLKYYRRWMADENEAVNARCASENAREACIRVFGRQSEDVLTALILMHSD